MTSRPLLLATTLWLGLSIAGFSEEFGDGERLFTLKIKPLFAEKCNGCHGNDPDKIKGDYDMLTRKALLAGGSSFGEEVLVPGDAKASFLMDAIRWDDPEFEMPPKENDRLSAEQIALVEKWINAGAPWPTEERQSAIVKADARKAVTEDGVLVTTSGGQGDEWTFRRYQPEDIWSFQPVAKPDLPRTSKEEHPIDAFVTARLEEAGLEPAPQADPLTLLRRLTYDLTGLPPTPEETQTFLTSWDKDPEATWSETIDRLLDSSHYGERWAQHWLDVVRYADTAGLSNDFERSNAWRYRDYVIRSLNKDVPYDQFVLQQLAGDEINPGNPESVVATGFLRMGPWEHTGMNPEPESRQSYIDDVVNSVGQVFLSTTMRCLKCHDHKFDPLPTRDYYRMYATFATTQPGEMEADYLPEENLDGFEASREHVQELLDYAKEKRDALYAKREEAAKEWYAARGLPYKDEATRKPLNEPKPPRFVGLTTEEEGRVKVREQDVRIWSRRLERFQPLAQSVFPGGEFAQASIKLRVPTRDALVRKMEKLPESHIHEGGSVYSPGEKVTPGVLSALGLPSPTATSEDPWALPQTMSGRRAALAQWIADPRNQLTTRSIVNRVWHYHFGKGIASNPNNFGATGGKPTHPELLDYLAATFVEQGWSLKELHRQILTSETWKRASQHPDLAILQEKDPNNDLLAVFEPRRLTAEELRDSMLAITGELNPVMGGLPIKPEMNREVALGPRMIQFSLAPAYQPSRTPEERNRRTIYAYRTRGLPDPLLQVFNQPGSDDSCEMRDAPSVTPQAFALLNSEVVTNRSIALAQRLEQEAHDVDTQIEQAWKLAFSREPKDSELARLKEHYSQMVTYHRQQQPEPIEYPTQITRSLVEEFSGDPFEYEELLNAYKDFTPDLQPHEVSAETRALADIALLIFNANEFAFLY